MEGWRGFGVGDVVWDGGFCLSLRAVTLSDLFKKMFNTISKKTL